MLFSLRRKAPKDSPRLPSRTLMLLLESAYPRLERCCSARKARTGHHSPCGGLCAAGKPAPAGANCRIALDARSACSAVACVPLRYANTCREPTEYIFGSHQRSSRRFAISFRSFLVRTRKEHVSPLPRRRYVLFSLRRKAPKDSPRRCLGLSCFCWGAYTHGSKMLQCSRSSHRPPLTVRKATAAWEARARRRKARAV